MPHGHGDASEVPPAFRLGEWLVEPMLNRIIRGGHSTQLRPRAMDVLVMLAHRPTEVVSKVELIDSVWRTEFVTENALTHVISELRTELGDDARNPSYIENIPRRGYRLIAEITPLEPRRSGVAEAVRTPASDDTAPLDPDINPYPGLAPFEEKDAPFFFGRETEISQLWRAISSRRLLAVIGPSGVGKSSFLGAGIKPAAPVGWAGVICQPGETPFASFARAFLPEFVGDVEAIEGLLGIRDGGSALPMISRWREQHERALLVIDQFEELFTLNPLETQEAYVGLIESLVEHTDIHVVLSMRDDFLHRCHSHQPLRPIFDQLTALEAPDPEALRLALVEPAGRLGFAFEDERMPSEMVAEVENERAALPLLAFSVAQLWDRRDRDRRVLTRAAYESIGGVSGSLARHADTTLEGLGRERLSMVRDLFRNLVTAENTRAVREYGDLLSIYPDDEQKSAEHVVRHLIDARLLTSYEDEQPGSVSTRRVEIIHESLLTNWPRLVRWQSQDADAARFRDELRQAARTWDERDRNADLLWTGSAFREYQLWKEQYPGGLTETEKAFGAAMTAHEFRRQRIRRWVSGAAFTALLAVLVVVSGFWRQSVRETRRAEAAKLLALGQVALTEERTRGLAYAMASLDLADTAEARRLALTALWEGPPATVVMPQGNYWWIAFSPGSDRMAVGSKSGRTRVFSQQPTPPVVLDDLRGTGIAMYHRFSPDGRQLMAWSEDPGNAVHIWQADDSYSFRSLEIPNSQIGGGVFENDGTVFTFGFQDIRRSRNYTERFGRWAFHRSPLAGGPPEPVGSIEAQLMPPPKIDLIHRFVVAADRNTLHLHRFEDLSQPTPQVVGRYPDVFALRTEIAIDPVNRRIAASDFSGNLMLWPIDGDGSSPERRLEAPRDPMSITFNSDGRLLAYAGRNGFRLWDLEGPVGAAPLVFGNAGRHIAFSPDVRWIATAGFDFPLALWPLTTPHVRTLKGHPIGDLHFRFSADGSHLYTVGASDGRVLSWDLNGGAGREPTVVFETPPKWGFGLEVDRNERFLIARFVDGIRKIPLDGGEPEVLEGFPRQDMELSPDGRYLGRFARGPSRKPGLQMLEMESGDTRFFEFPGEGRISNWYFESKERVLVARGGVLYRWNPEAGSEQVLIPMAVDLCSGPAEGRLLCWLDDSPIVLELENGTQKPVDLPDGWSQLGQGPAGPIVVTQSDAGEISVTEFDSTVHHLLLPHDRVGTSDVACSPDGRWIAADFQDGSIRLWPMPDFSKPPLHTLPHDELMATLESLTNLRVVPDDENPTGYRVEVDMSAYRGWETTPEW